MPYKDPEIRKIKQREYVRRYRENHPDRVKEQTKRQYLREKASPEKTAIARTHIKTWQQINKDKMREYRARTRSKPEQKESRKQYNSEWQRANPDKRARYHREYMRRNPEKRREINRLIKAKRKGATGKFTQSEWKSLCARYGNMCLACQRTDVKLTADHIIPLVQGGTNTIDNIQPLCASCNSKKKDRAIDYTLRYR